MRTIAMLCLLTACAVEDPGSDAPGELQQFKVTLMDIPISTSQTPLSVASPCIDVPLADADPDEPGKQYDCSITMTWDGGEQVLPACGANGGADDVKCWRLVEDRFNCFDAESLKLDILPDARASFEHHMLLQCVSI